MNAEKYSKLKADIDGQRIDLQALLRRESISLYRAATRLRRAKRQHADQEAVVSRLELRLEELVLAPNNPNES